MIKSLPIRRAKVNAPITDPIQISKNLQISINNGTNITILDPKLPTIHKSIINMGKEAGNLLDPQELYDVTNIMNLEFIETLGIRNLDNLMIEDIDGPFTLSRLYEPLVSSHKWSFIDPNTRDCYLGVLLTTSELIILKRNTLDPGNYTAVFMVFHNLLEQLYLPIENLSPDGDVIVSKDQFNSLTVDAFEFSQVLNSDSQFVDLLCIINHNRDVSIYYLQEGLPQAVTTKAAKNYIKITWVPWTSVSGKQSSLLLLTSTQNGVDVLHLSYDPHSEIFDVVGIKPVLQQSRFLVTNVSTINFQGSEYIVVVQANFIKLFKLEQNGETKLSNQSQLNCSCIPAGVNPFISDQNRLIIDISYENGTFQRFEFKDSQLQPSKTPKLLNSFVDRSIYTYQQIESKVDDETTDDNIPFTGKFVNLGTKLIEQSGMLLVIHKTVARAINYTINSLQQYVVSWIPINSLGVNFNPKSDTNATSLAQINSIWFTKYAEIPPVPRLVQENNVVADINNFVSVITKFKTENFRQLSYLIDSETNQAASNLQQVISTNVHANPTVKSLQLLFNFNITYLKSLNTLHSKAVDNEELKKAIEEINKEQTTIKDQLRNIFIGTTLSYLDTADMPLDTFDQFLVMNYFLILGKEKKISKMPSSAKIVLTTPFLSESFTISLGQKVDTTINSDSNHHWSRCALTMFPLIDLVNKRDELLTHNYMAYNYDLDPNSIVHTLLTTLNYCVYTGNKTYNVGV